MNLAMILSGQDPVEMCERWRTLDQTKFMSLFPLRQYLRSPRWPALGSGDGVRHQVFPHLGIDVERIRAATGMAGTFNVCNFSRKVAEVVNHSDVDLDLLVAGVSLPILMPSVSHGGDTYFDAVWVRDSNTAEAVRRGADEVWLVWCIGNTPDYLNGSFRQYVHMIEVAANASLFADFERVRTVNKERAKPVVLHVVKPDTPIPLDPDYFLGRIDAGTLLESGYRDACAYLRHMKPAGIAWDPEATKMRRANPAVLVRSTLRGHLAVGDGAPGELVVQLSPEIPDACRLGRSDAFGAPTTGSVTTPLLGTNVPFRRARTAISPDGHLSFEATVVGPTGLVAISGCTSVGIAVMPVVLCEGESSDGPTIATGDVTLDRRAWWSAAITTHVNHATTTGDRLRAVSALGVLALRQFLHRRRLGR